MVFKHKLGIPKIRSLLGANALTIRATVKETKTKWKDFLNLCLDRVLPKTPFALLKRWGHQINEIESMRSVGVDKIIIKPINMSEALGVINALVRPRKDGQYPLGQ